MAFGEGSQKRMVADMVPPLEKAPKKRKSKGEGSFATPAQAQSPASMPRQPPAIAPRPKQPSAQPPQPSTQPSLLALVPMGVQSFKAPQARESFVPSQGAGRPPTNLPETRPSSRQGIVAFGGVRCYHVPDHLWHLYRFMVKQVGSDHLELTRELPLEDSVTHIGVLTVQALDANLKARRDIF